MLFNEDGEWITYEFREFIGWRRRTLTEQLIQFPKQIDVFRPASSVSFHGKEPKHWDKTSQDVASAVMQQWRGLPYGWSQILKMALHYLPLLRLVPQETKDDATPSTFVCSTAVAVALRRSFCDMVPFLSDGMVTPTDLARSALLEYQFSITEDR